MAIGTTAAILGSAVIGAGASAVSGSRNSRAIRESTNAQTESNAQSLALQSNIYNQNRATLNPFVQRGNVAGDQINALLGLGGSQVQGGPARGTLPTGTPNALSQFEGYPGGAGAAYGLGDTPGFAPQRGFNPAAFGDAYGNSRGTATLPYGTAPFQGGVPQVTGLANAPGQGTAPVSGGSTGQTAQQAQLGAFDTFRNSTGYQFRLGEGLDAVNSGYAGAGLLQSGAALRGITEYGQNFASNEFGNYVGLLSGQQGTGLQAAGAQAGVGVNYANAASSINQNNANALSNAAVARANNSNSVIGGIGNAFGGAIGALAYQAPRAPTPGFDATLR